jgi:hypothetical protein
MGRTILLTAVATIAVFVAWSAMDFVIHQLILSGDYGRTNELWRPEDQLIANMSKMPIVTAVAAAAFVSIYAFLISPKSVVRGIQFGTLFGVAGGVSMGFGIFLVMPILYSIAFTWFAGAVIEGAVAGLLAGLIVRPAAPGKSGG